MYKFTVYADPAHSWTKVPRKLLYTLGIINKITPFSYQRGEYVYLEEDCDMATFLHAWKQRFSALPTFTEQHTNRSSKIRSYQPYAA